VDAKRPERAGERGVAEDIRDLEPFMTRQARAAGAAAV